MKLWDSEEYIIFWIKDDFSITPSLVFKTKKKRQCSLFLVYSSEEVLNATTVSEIFSKVKGKWTTRFSMEIHCIWIPNTNLFIWYVAYCHWT